MAGSNPVPSDASALPIPPAWAGRRTLKAVRSVAFLAVLGVGLAACGGVAVWWGDGEIGIPILAIAILLGHVVVLGIRGRSVRRRRGARAALVADPKTTTKAVRFTYSGWAYYWGVAVVVMTELLGLGLTVLRASAGGPLNLAGATVFGGLTLYIGWFLVTMLRLAPGQVTLSPAGVFHRGLTSTHFVPWHAVGGVSARWLDTPMLSVEAFPSEDTDVRSYMGRFGAGERKYLPFMVIRAVWLPDTVLVYHALCFYHAHPDLRAELSTEDGVDRINSGRAACAEPDEAKSPVQPG